MVTLTTEDRQQLIHLLKDVPELATEGSRREILELAGLKKVLPHIDLSGSQYIVCSKIVSYLSDYGRLTYKHEALGVFLNFMATIVGQEQKDILAALLGKYGMMVPITPSPAADTWQGKDNPTTVFEKIIGENTLRSIAFLAQGLEVARSVAYIGVQKGSTHWSGSGFLIAPDIMLTNHHVISHADLLPTTLFRFHYEENFKGELLEAKEYRARSNGLFHANEELDYAVIQLDGEPGKEWGWLPVIPKIIKRGERVNIIQHPNGLPKQIALQNNFVEYSGGNVVQYVTSTQPGSSGSPVLNDEWEVVALHHAGGTIPEPTTQRRYFRNEGILIGKIIDDLPPEFAQLVSVTG